MSQVSFANAKKLKSFLAPHADQDWLAALSPEDEADEVIQELDDFREVIIRWHGATVLPIDQLILTLSQDIFTSPTDLALAHKLALVLRQVADENPQWRLPELTPSLHEIARNERRFIGFSSDDAGLIPMITKAPWWSRRCTKLRGWNGTASI